MLDDIVFTRNVAMLAAQVGPVLVIAFVVEFRSIAGRASVERRDLFSIMAAVFGALIALLAVCLVVVNSPDDWRGWPALIAWSVSVSALAVIVIFVAFGAWAAVNLTATDAADGVVEADAAAQRLRNPGWKWFLRGRPEPIHVVAGVIMLRDGRVLACRRRAGKTSAGKWEFPGGKVEHGELAADALVRELREELGIRSRVIAPLTSDITEVGGTVIRLSCFIVKVVGRKPTSSSDHDRLRWVAPAELHTLDWTEPDLPAVRALSAL